MRIILKSYFADFKILNFAEKKKIYLILTGNILISFMDLLSIVLVSIVASSVIPVIQSKSTEISQTLTMIRERIAFIERMDINVLLITLTILLIVLLCLKSLLSFLLLKRSQTLMGEITSRYSKDVLRAYLALPSNMRQKMDDSTFLNTFQESVESLVFQRIGNKVLVIYEVIGLIVIFIPLIIAAPLIIFMIVSLFIAIRLTIDRFLLKNSRFLGNQASDLFEQTNRKLLDIKHIEDEAKVFGTLNYFLEDYEQSRKDFSKNKAERLIEQNKPRTYLEILILISLIPIIYLIWLLYSVQIAITVLSMMFIFIVRLVPAISRIMSLRVSILQHKALSEVVLNIHRDLNPQTSKLKIPNSLFNGKKCEVHFENVQIVSENKKVLATSINKMLIGPGIYLIVGENGTGKSTILKYVIGKYNIDIGTIKIHSRSSKLAISYLPQNPRKLHANLEENLLVKRQNGHVPRDLMLSRANRILRSLDPNGSLNSKSLDFSGGEFQKIAITRTLCSDADIVLMDEPTTFLDSTSVRSLVETLKEASLNKLILIASHDLEFIKLLKLNNSHIWNLDLAFENRNDMNKPESSQIP